MPQQIQHQQIVTLKRILVIAAVLYCVESEILAAAAVVVVDFQQQLIH
jgi:hypothetical protein